MIVTNVQGFDAFWPQTAKRRVAFVIASADSPPGLRPAFARVFTPCAARVQLSDGAGGNDYPALKAPVSVRALPDGGRALSERRSSLSLSIKAAAMYRTSPPITSHRLRCRRALPASAPTTSVHV